MDPAFQARVVVGTDGSTLGDHAVRWALEYARARRLPLHLAAVADGRHGPSERAFEHLRTTLGTSTRLCRSTAPELGITDQQPVQASVESLLAAAQDAAVLVVGATGSNHPGPAALDGRAHCPIAFVDSGRWPDPATPVVAGISGGEQDDQILEHAYDMASRCAAALILVHSWHDAHTSEFGPRADAEALVEQAEVRWAAKYPRVLVLDRVVGGPPTVVLSSLTRKAGLLVVGSGNSGVAALAVRYAHCPVLVIQ